MAAIPTKKQTMHSYLRRIVSELGLLSLYHSPLDTKLLCLARFSRFFGYGGTTLVLATHLSSLGISDPRIGLFMTLTLAGDVVLSFFLTLYADRLGRKSVLSLGALLMVASGIVFGVTSNYVALLLAAVFGVISPSGNEVGPFRAVEESTLAQLTEVEKRSDVFAWYVLIGYFGTALGMLSAGWIVEVATTRADGDPLVGYRVIFFIYAAVGFVKFLLICGLSKDVEVRRGEAVVADDGEDAPLLQNAAAGEEVEDEVTKVEKTFLSIEKENMRIYIQLALFLGLDSLATGLATNTWLTYYFRRKFNLDEGRLGSLFSGLGIITTLSILASSSIAKRIGNVKAMCFTHLPAAIMLILVPIPSKLAPAMVFLIIRSCSTAMDVAPRSAFLTTVIAPNERTAVMGLLNVIKTMTQAVGPLVTGVLASKDLFGAAFIVAGVMKVCYDLGILAAFSGHKSQRKVVEDEDCLRSDHEDSEA